MTIARQSDRPGIRVIGAVLSTLAMATSPLVAAPAQADTASDAEPFVVNLFTPDPSGTFGSFDLVRDSEYEGGTVYSLQAGDSKPEHDFTVEPGEDGKFRLKNSASGQCLAKVPQDGTYPGDLTESACGETNAEWYVQPASNSRYRIRHVEDDLCLSVPEVSRFAPGRVETCSGDNRAQIWGIGGRINRPDQLNAMATRYALKQFDEHSSVIPSATYKVDGATTATVGRIEKVSVGPPAKNGTSRDMDQSMNWTQTTGYTYTAGGSVTTTAGITVGGEKSPVSAQFSVAVQGNWSNSWSTSETDGGFVTIHIPPGEYGWIARGQLTKTVTGTWTITNDMGETWTGYGTGTVPAKDGTDGRHSSFQGCTSDVKDKYAECQQTDPGRPTN
ncbi:hypothetical protein CP981_01385 [Streptomyces platensis]|uniref:Ricin B lectin domain-containing protein n=1 Tax=Streptomyces platensis TaxID=58346 RepID=A0AAE6NCV0_STRPT|nr:RICIN domain-containing protein [Streptomyces platensis]OSY41684.1 hypothetical protein BG653_05047 [Streptomyces platensis]QEV50504.1 hypothetical protein CP981_01385 [Streptomyces platensis]